MPLRPSSPVQLVTRALRSIPPAYQTSVWHAGSFRYTAATFGTHRAASVAAGTEYAGWAGTGMRHLRARRKLGHPVGNSSDGTTFGEPGHRSASCDVDDRLSSGPAISSLAPLLGILRHVPRSR